MTKNEVIQLLENSTNPRGLANWKKDPRHKIESYGIGLTQLRKLGKQIGKNHELAVELWEVNNHDVKTISLLIDDPKKMTEQQAELQVEGVNHGHLAHVFSSCDAALGKTPFVVELATKWIHQKDNTRKRCGYGLIYEISKSKKISAPTNDFFLEIIEEINQQFFDEKLIVQGAMGGALMGIGKRNIELNKPALIVAKKIGLIYLNPKNKNCEPFDVVKHLTSDYLKNKFKQKKPA